MKVKSESEIGQSCPTLSDPMDCSLPVSSVHGIFQARVLESGAIAFSGINARQTYNYPLVENQNITVVLVFGIQSRAKPKSFYFYSSIHLDTSNMICSLLIHLIGNYISS